MTSTATRTRRKAYKGIGMEGPIATWYAKNTGRDMREYRKIAQAVAGRLPGGSSVLEVAPGPGYLAIELAKLGDYRITGLDISKSFVRIARENARRAGVTIDFLRGGAAQMPFPDESFDFVVCRAAFKNFSDPVGALDEIHRVLRPGGKQWRQK
jgi:ubiquinone/menaquinone biosynthesis C-methylase UbiE